MGDVSPAKDDVESSLTTVSSMTTYSISMTDSTPSVPIFEVQQLADAVEEPVDKVILSARDFTIWQPAGPTVNILEGLRVTPPYVFIDFLFFEKIIFSLLESL